MCAIGVDNGRSVWDVCSTMDGMSRNIDHLPGYRRRIRVHAEEGRAVALLEDDFHCMTVTLFHDGETVTAIEPVVERAPWTTCPGAPAKLVETFAGLPLAAVTARRDKKANCTHLHDLAVIAAAHAGERGTLTYDVLASDPVDGERLLEIRRDGEVLWHWVEQGGVLAAPAEVAGQALFGLRDWINGLDEPLREAARLLQWAAMVAHGRTLPLERQSIAAEMPANCYTFQPDRAAKASRNGKSVDFSSSSRLPLDPIDDQERARQPQV